MEKIKTELNASITVPSQFSVKHTIDEMKSSVDLIAKQIEDLEKQKAEIAVKVLEAEKQLEADKAATEYAKKKLETTQMTLELMKQEADTKRLEQESLRSKYLEGHAKYEQSKTQYEHDILERRNRNLEADRKRYFLELKHLEDKWRKVLFGGITLVAIVLAVVIFLFYNRFIAPSKGNSIISQSNPLAMFTQDKPKNKILPEQKTPVQSKDYAEKNSTVPKDSLFSSDDNSSYSDNNFNLVFENAMGKYSSGNMNGAIEDFSKAIQIKPNSFDAYYNRGLAKYLKSDFDGAISDFEKAISLDPYNKEAEIAKVKAENKKSLAQQNEGETAGLTSKDISGDQTKRRP